MVKQDVVGQLEYVKLPDLMKGSVAARIDTGARTSAIWASKLKENDKTLQVTFFGPSSEYYDGKAYTFKEYAKVKVVNSTGLAQRRYKVRLLLVINGRPIRAWFTLANRSKQTYPILIGRNVLRGKFVVDVAQKTNNSQNLSNQPVKVTGKVRRPKL